MYQELQADGIDIQQLRIPRVGNIDMLEISAFNDNPYLNGMAIILPKNDGPEDLIAYRPLIGSENREIGYKPVVLDNYDLKQGHIFGEYGWEWAVEHKFGIIKGIEF